MRWRPGRHEVRYQIRWKKTARRQLNAEIPEHLRVDVVNYMEGPVAIDPHGEGVRLRYPFSYQLSAGCCHDKIRIIYQVDDEKLQVTVDTVSMR